MARNYSEKEKREYLDRFKVSGKSKTIYARENGIPEATFRAWIKEQQYGMFGAVEINQQEQASQKQLVKSIIFCNENIRIELKEGYDKEYLKRIFEKNSWGDIIMIRDLLKSVSKVYLAYGATDFRKQIDSLCIEVRRKNKRCNF